MSDMQCEACGVDVTTWSARYGERDTTFCKKCYKTDVSETIIENKVIASEDDLVIPEPVIELKNIDSSNQNVVVTDIKMPFWSMVEFMVKWAVASIPAIIILFIAFGLISLLFGGLFR